MDHEVVREVVVSFAKTPSAGGSFVSLGRLGWVGGFGLGLLRAAQKPEERA